MSSPARWKKPFFISIHCPINDLTRHLIGEKEFKRMEKKPLLINTSRGPIIDEKALIEALKEGLITGARFDVLEKEPPDSVNPMLAMSLRMSVSIRKNQSVN